MSAAARRAVRCALPLLVATVFAAVLLAVSLAVLPVGPGFAQDTAPPADAAFVEVEVRTDRSLTEPGRPVIQAEAAWVMPGWTLPPYVSDTGDPVPTETMRADSSGVIRVPLHPPGPSPAALLVWGPDLAPVALYPTSDARRIVALREGRKLRTQTVRTTGEAVVGAVVRTEIRLEIVGAPPDGSREFALRAAARTSEGGFASLGPLPDSQLLLIEASADGLVPGSAFPVDPKSGGVVVVLARGSTLGGTLRMRPSGPIPAGSVAIAGELRAPVAESGVYLIPAVPPGPVRLTFEGPGFTPPPPRTVLAAEGRERTDLDAEAVRTSTLRIRLLPPEGSFLPSSVRIDAEWPPSSQVAPRSIAADVDTEGSVRQDGLAAADGVAIRIEAQGFVPEDLEPVSLPPGAGTREIQVSLRRAAFLSGLVTDSAGQPVPDAEVEVVAHGPGTKPQVSAMVRTAADGRFRADGVAPGDADLVVRPPGLGGSARFGPFRAAAGEMFGVGTLTVTQGHTLRGSVEGAPTGAVVRWTPSVASASIAERSAAPRAFTFVCLAAGPGLVEVVDGDSVLASERVSLPSAWPLTLRCGERLPLRVHIADDSGAPVIDAQVTLTPLGGADPGAAAAGIPMTRSALRHRDATGRFVARVPTGRWLVVVRDARGRTGSAETDVPLPVGGDPLPIVVRPGTSVRGHVFGGIDGDPVEGASVTAYSGGATPRPVGSAVTGDAGFFEISGVPPGIVRIRIEAAGHPVHLGEPFLVRVADAPDIGRITLGAGMTVSGTVTGGGRTAESGLVVEIEGVAGTRRSSATDPWGRYELRGLPSGPAVLRLLSADRGVAREQRVLLPSRAAEHILDVNLDEGTRLTGRVSSGGRDESFALVRASCGGASVSAVADAFGLFALPPIPRGPARIDVTPHGGGEPWTSRVFVLGGSEQGVELRASEGFVAGRVTASDGGRSVAAALLVLRRFGSSEDTARGFSSSDGSFRLDRLPAGSYLLTASAPGLGTFVSLRIAVPVSGGVHDVDVPLPPEGAIAATLVDSLLRPLTGASLEARPDQSEDHSRSTPVRRSSAGPGGRVRLDGLARGSWVLAAVAPGFGRTELGSVRVDEGVRDLGEIIVRDEAVLVVEVLSAFRGGDPVVVELRDAYDRDPRPQRLPDDALRGPDRVHATDENGRLRIGGLAPGTYRVRAAGAPAGAEIRVMLRSGAVTRIWLPVPLLR